MPLFDEFIAVDWSARNAPSPITPSRDAIWVGEGSAGDSVRTGESYWRTRSACVEYLRTTLIAHIARSRRILLGFDFAFGYPSGFAAAAAIDGSGSAWLDTWRELQRLIVDNAGNSNNRFEVAASLNQRCGGDAPGPFWGLPIGRSLPHLLPNSPVYPYQTGSGILLQRLREIDHRERGVQPVWKLYGNGSVGGQTLVGIPALLSLREDRDLAPFTRVWPFETGFTARPTASDGPAIILAEIWPGIATALDPTITIRDQSQVRALIHLLMRLDAADELGPFFDLPLGLSVRQQEAVLQEEGWILGAGRNPRPGSLAR